jgi:mRNA interferase RelE/StbE
LSQARSQAARRYNVVIQRNAQKQLNGLPRQSQARVMRAIDGLAIDPRPPSVVKLSGEENLYRVRAGDYRVIYSVQDAALLVLIVKVGDRKDVYR